MIRSSVSLLIAGVVIAAPAIGDTVYLKNGVQFDGVVTPVPDQPGLYQVAAGERSLIYRESEIDKIEKNERTGRLDREALLARWQEKSEQLNQETGLTTEQRRMVRGLMFELKSDSIPQRLAVREKLIGLQAQFDVYGYLVTLYPELSNLLAPNVLEALFYLDPIRCTKLLQESATSNYFGKRAMALELIGRANDRNSIELVVRGLADHKHEVKIAAAYVLAALGVREATPALIEILTHPDQRVANACREALLALWAESLGDTRPGTVDEWKAFWSQQSTTGTPVVLANLEPLSLPENEFTQSIDGNH